jgi:hypothetical protein
MIQNLTIEFEYNGLQYSIKVPDNVENLPYNLAAAFIEVTKLSDTSSDVIIGDMISEFGYSNEE